MADMADPDDRWRILEKLNDDLVALQNKHSPSPLSGEEPVNLAWVELYETVAAELEAAREAVA